jgi:hypothetical protein
MATISKFSVVNATQIDPGNWVALQDTFGPQLIPSSAARGDCIVQATTSPADSPAEWNQLLWSGGTPVAGQPNQRSISRQQSAKVTVKATLAASTAQVTVWVMWATVDVRTSGPRPPRARPWSTGAAFTGGDSCGAFTVQAFTMTENARGQVVVVARLEPPGVGRVTSAGGKSGLLKIRRQVTAHDFAEGKKFSAAKSFVPWADDDSLPSLTTLDPGPDDTLYDTDGPDLPMAANSSETYNNFRQWVTFANAPCSNYGTWFFRARWQNQKVTLKELGPGARDLPNAPFYK